MTQFNDKIKMKALLPTVQGTYGLVKSAADVASKTVENQLTPMKHLKNILVNDAFSSVDAKIKDDFIIACDILNTFLADYYNDLAEASSQAKTYQRAVTRQLDDLVGDDKMVNLNSFVDETNRAIEVLSASVTDGKTVTDKFNELFGNISGTYDLFKKSLAGEVSTSDIEKSIDEIYTASKQVVNSVNVVSTSLTLLSSLVVNEAK